MDVPSTIVIIVGLVLVVCCCQIQVYYCEVRHNNVLNVEPVSSRVYKCRHSKHGIFNCAERKLSNFYRECFLGSVDAVSIFTWFFGDLECNIIFNQLILIGSLHLHDNLFEICIHPQTMGTSCTNVYIIISYWAKQNNWTNSLRYIYTNIHILLLIVWKKKATRFWSASKVWFHVRAESIQS